MANVIYENIVYLKKKNIKIMYLLFTYFTGCEIFSCDSCRTKKRTGSNTHVKYNYTQLKLIYTMKSKYMSIFNIIT